MSAAADRDRFATRARQLGKSALQAQVLEQEHVKELFLELARELLETQFTRPQLEAMPTSKLLTLMLDEVRSLRECLDQDPPRDCD